MNESFNSSSSRLALLGTLLMLAACASTPAPVVDVAMSEASVTRASAAGGAALAPAEMTMARDKLERAKVAMAAQNYELARALAEESQLDAQLAEAKARSSKARKTANDDLEGIRALREELDRKTSK